MTEEGKGNGEETCACHVEYNISINPPRIHPLQDHPSESLTPHLITKWGLKASQGSRGMNETVRGA